MALNSLFCADVPLSNYSLTPRRFLTISAVTMNDKIVLRQLVMK